MKKDKCLYALAYHQKMRLRRSPPLNMTPTVKRKLTLRRSCQKPWGKCA